MSLYTSTSVCIYSILFFIQFLMCWQGEFVQQSRDSSVVYHFLYSHNLMFDSGVILKGEIRCQSLSGIKGFITTHFYTPLLAFVGNNAV